MRGAISMFRPMRRFKQALSPEECRAVLERGTSGVLALTGDGGWPYAVPLSYVYADGKLYFHSAKSGHKVDAIRSCPRASFCVIDQDHIVPAPAAGRTGTGPSTGSGLPCVCWRCRWSTCPARRPSNWCGSGENDPSIETLKIK